MSSTWEHHYETFFAAAQGGVDISKVKQWVEQMTPCGWHLAAVVSPVYLPQAPHTPTHVPDWAPKPDAKPERGPETFVVVLKREVGGDYKEGCEKGKGDTEL